MLLPPSSTVDILSLAMVSRDELAAARRLQQVKALERQGRLSALNDYVSFAVSKTLGLGGLAVGGMGIFDPQLLHFTLSNPPLFVGAGIALLTGKNVVNLINRMFGQ